MKNLIITFCLTLFSLVTFSQASFTIVGLNTKDAKKAITFNIVKAELSNQKVIISRTYDASTSGFIKDACKTKRLYVSGYIKTKNNGFKINFTQLALRNYSWKIDANGRVTEYFEIIYQKLN